MGKKKKKDKSGVAEKVIIGMALIFAVCLLLFLLVLIGFAGAQLLLWLSVSIENVMITVGVCFFLVMCFFIGDWMDGWTT